MSSPLALLTDFELERVMSYASDIVKRRSQSEQLQVLLDRGTDAEIIEWAHDYLKNRRAPITLANTYGNRLHWYQEIVPSSHPRRPVAMRGSKEVRVAMHSRSTTKCPNGWAAVLFERALRLSKSTALCYEDYQDIRDNLRKKINSKYSTSYHFDNSLPSVYFDGRDFNQCLVAGKLVCLSNNELTNVRALREIIKKTDKLDQRMRLAREHFRQRMAA